MALFSLQGATTYTFTDIANSARDGIGYLVGMDVNDAGLVAFNSGGTVYAGDGSTLNMVVNGTGAGWWPTINNSGTVGFATISGVYTNTDGLIASGLGLVDVGLNDLGAVAYADSTSVHLVIPGLSNTTLLDVLGPISGFYSGPALNNSGTVAFNAGLDNATSGMYFSNGGGAFTKVADTTDGFTQFEDAPSLNNNGVVAFTGVTAVGRTVAVGSGGALTPIAVACAACQYTDVGRAPDINDNGLVAFTAQKANGHSLVVTGDGTTTSTVIESGSSLFGSQFLYAPTGQTAVRPRINNNGQVVFGYELANGVFGVALATPVSDVPEPASITLSAVAAIALAIRRRMLDCRNG